MKKVFFVEVDDEAQTITVQQLTPIISAKVELKAYGHVQPNVILGTFMEIALYPEVEQVFLREGEQEKRVSVYVGH